MYTLIIDKSINATKKFRANYHIHTSMSDGFSEPVDYVEKAVEAGLTEIGFTDHLVILDDASVGLGSLDVNEIDSYIETIEDVRKSSEKVIVKCGLEVDYTPGGVKYVEEILNSYKDCLDYTLMGVHIIDGFHFDTPESVSTWRSLSQNEIDKLYRRYYELVLEGVETGIFTVVAHLDIVKKFGFKPSEEPLKLVESILESVKTLDMAVEISSAGLRHPAQELYPSSKIVDMLAFLQVPVTMATDAHKPEDVSAGLDLIAMLIKLKKLPLAIPANGLKILNPLEVL
ncbi:histidinol-phosphatase [Candidatus Bathyarchaeota archaeon]|nr:histidinol-phosphatase [Candidatus Bathyarchaeota archaeon]MBS7617951.1 histidinol-phosphatase [Candidatus Bathyarchaeota archaeon]